MISLLILLVCSFCLRNCVCLGVCLCLFSTHNWSSCICSFCSFEWTISTFCSSPSSDLLCSCQWSGMLTYFSIESHSTAREISSSKVIFDWWWSLNRSWPSSTLLMKKSFANMLIHGRGTYLWISHSNYSFDFIREITKDLNWPVPNYMQLSFLNLRTYTRNESICHLLFKVIFCPSNHNST